MGCTCIKPTNEFLFHEFVQNIKLKSCQCKDFVVTIKKYISKGLDSNNFEVLMKNNLISYLDQNETHGTYFREIYNQYNNDKEKMNIFLITLLLLCNYNSSDLKDCYNNHKVYFVDKIKVDDNKNMYIEKNLLYDILRLYTKMISVYIIKHISCQSNNKEEFEIYFKSIYNDTTIELFLNEFYVNLFIGRCKLI